ncbi:MAG: ABC transporter substrate-binding protein, partial [Cyanobacteria bacterium J06627_28]
MTMPRKFFRTSHIGHRWLLVALSGLLLGSSSLLVVACRATTSTPQPATDTATDISSETNAADSIQRIVTLTSLSADLVSQLDNNKLVGIPGSSLLEQEDRFAQKTVVSAGRTEPDLEKIISLEPDLVIGSKGMQDKTLQKLNELNIPVLAAEVNSWESLYAFTTTLAQQMSADPESLLARYNNCLANAPEQPISALVLVSRQPLLAPNANSWAGDFLAQMNIQNLAADWQGNSPIAGYITLSAEKVIEADPNSLMIVSTDDSLLSQLETEPFWSQLKATQ